MLAASDEILQSLFPTSGTASPFGLLVWGAGRGGHTHTGWGGERVGARWPSSPCMQRQHLAGQQRWQMPLQTGGWHGE